MTNHQINLNREFTWVIYWLEKYIEIVYKQEFPDWEQRKQVKNNPIKRKDLTEKTAIEVGNCLSLIIYMFEEDVPTDPENIQKELTTKFYQWISAIKLEANQAPDLLKHYLFGIHEILSGQEEREKINYEAENRNLVVDPEKLAEAWGEIWTRSQLPAPTIPEINFNGKAKEGEKIFQQIKNSIINQHGSFHYWPQKREKSNEKDNKKKIENQKSFFRQNKPLLIIGSTILILWLIFWVLRKKLSKRRKK